MKRAIQGQRRVTRCVIERARSTRARTPRIEEDRKIGAVCCAVVVDVSDAWHTPVIEERSCVVTVDDAVHGDVAIAMLQRRLHLGHLGEQSVVVELLHLCHGRARGEQVEAGVVDAASPK